MMVTEIMSKDVLTVTPETSYRDIWKMIFSSHRHTLPVVDKRNRLIGIVSRKDVLAKLYPNYQDVLEFLETPQDFEEMEGRIAEMSTCSVRDIMCRSVIFARETTLVMRALSRMIVRHVDQLPILNGDDEVVGVVTKGDIFYSLFKKNFEKSKEKKSAKSQKKSPGRVGKKKS